jgi:hypothetical protein
VGVRACCSFNACSTLSLVGLFFSICLMAHTPQRAPVQICSYGDPSVHDLMSSMPRALHGSSMWTNVGGACPCSGSAGAARHLQCRLVARRTGGFVLEV